MENKNNYLRDELKKNTPIKPVFKKELLDEYIKSLEKSSTTERKNTRKYLNANYVYYKLFQLLDKKY